MDSTQSPTPATDDQELAKVLNSNVPVDSTDSSSGLHFEETGISGNSTDTPASVADTPASDVAPAVEPAQTDLPAPTPPAEHTASTAPTGELDTIKKDVLEELRPLVDKLELPADEKFDIMLLIIRSTDDHSLVKPAHEAAKLIEDDQKRAQALLDVVKEIDYFANQTK